ncbi:MAG TPA: site-specific DNA-methyltransferase [Phycisphaerae bacterium]|nr:site-specific DNA-methyltransferase [Phycisphaerae bacterium]
MKLDTIYCGDACELLESWSPGTVDLAFADPPFNIGYVYDKYQDDLPDEQYVGWCRRWMAGCQRVLKASGSFYIAIGDDFAAETRMLGRELGLHLRNWIVWHYTFGQNTKNKFCRAHTHIFYFTKHSSRFTFNDQALRFPSARHTEYQDLRANPAGRLPDDVWDEYPRVCGTFRERAGFHGCQMPEALLMRIILASSNPGDVVLDPFVGSGTTAVAAKRLGRRYVGIDISPEYVKHTQERLAATAEQRQITFAGQDWPSLHEDLLMQVYRETKVSLANLLPNEVALRVIATALNARTGAAYEAADIAEELQKLSASNRLPKLPNDTQFVQRKHVKEEGKRYERTVQRWRGRKKAGGRARRKLRPAS